MRIAEAKIIDLAENLDMSRPTTDSKKAEILDQIAALLKRFAVLKLSEIARPSLLKVMEGH